MTPTPLESFYAFLWPPQEDEGRKALLATMDEDIGGRPIDSLYDLAAEIGFSATSVVLDAGCGRGNHSAKLAARFGCRVVAMDPIASNLSQIAAAAEKENVTALVTSCQGSFESIPAEPASFDFVWCRDSLNHAADLELSFAEIARVLRPSGKLLLYCAVGTERVRPEELPPICDPLALNPATLQTDAIDAAIAKAGLQIRMETSTSAEHSPYREPLSEGEGRDVYRLARLLRAPDKYKGIFGEERYRLLLALYTWRAYWTIGKMEQRLWVVEKGT